MSDHHKLYLALAIAAWTITLDIFLREVLPAVLSNLLGLAR